MHAWKKLLTRVMLALTDLKHVAKAWRTCVSVPALASQTKLVVWSEIAFDILSSAEVIDLGNHG